MRSKTYQTRWAEKKKDLEKPEWYMNNSLFLLSFNLTNNPLSVPHNSYITNGGCRFILLEEEVVQVFGEDGLEHLGNEALNCLKKFMCIRTETIHYVVVSLV
jgi:hypothetical protein